MLKQKQLNILFYLILAFCMLPTVLHAAVERTVSGSACTPTVSITITPDSATSAWVYKEYVYGITPTGISNNGVWQAYPGAIRWGINLSADPQTFSYTLAGPDGTYSIYGNESFDGSDADTAATSVIIDCASVNPAMENVVSPVFDQPSGADTPVTVAITSGTAGASIYFTTDGTLPNSSSALYTGPLLINNTTMLQAIAMKTGMLDSAVSRAFYTNPPIVPVQNLERSINGTACRPIVGINVTPKQGISAYIVQDVLPSGLIPENISDDGIWSQTSSTIRWAIFLDDTTRTFTYELTGPDADYSLSGTGSFDGRGYDIGGTSQATIDCIPDQAMAPVINPASGSRVPVTVSMTTDTTGGEIRYTTDGSEPNEASLLYSAPIAITSPSTIKAKTFKSGLGASETAQASYLPQKRPKAIIVAGGGPYSGNSLWPATSYVSSYAYKALLYQGYAKDDIKFFSHDATIDLDANGELDDIDGASTIENIEQAIAVWAKDAEEVLVFLTDHGGNKTFLLGENNYMNATDLAGWLNTLQETMTGRLILIYDACQSGTFIPELIPPTGKDRIIITSSSNEPAVFLEGGVLSFSYQFWSNVFYTGKLYDAFLHGSGLMKNDQRALLEVNGNGIANEKADKLGAADIMIGRGMVAATAPPHINSSAADQTINSGPSATVWVSGITSLDPIASVWAVIMPPNYHPGNASTPITNLPKIDLLDTNNDGQYQAVYDGFTIHGKYRLVIYAKDKQGAISAPRQINVTQNAGEISPNNAPTANAAAISTNEDTKYQGNLSANDADSDILNFSIVADGNIGTVSITDVNTGAFTYYPHQNENGNDSFTFKVNDGTEDSGPATVTVTINAVEDVPLAQGMLFSMERNTILADNFKGLDGDGDSLTFAIASQPSHGVASLVNENTGAFTYTPVDGYYGTDTFTFTANDGKATSYPGNSIITIDRGFNNPPSANDISTSGPEDTTINGTLTGTDPDSDSLTFIIATTPAHGTVVLNDADAGTYSYTPEANYFGSDSFMFKSSDGLADSAPATCTINVSSVNDAPTVQDGYLSITDISGGNGQLRAVDVEGDPIIFAISQNGLMGKVTITDAGTGAYSYTPDSMENGIDTFKFTASDGSAVSGSAEISVSIKLSQAEANRVLTGDGCKTDIGIVVTPADTVDSYLVVEKIPEGIAPSNINENGLWDIENRKIKWGLFGDNAQRTFSYTVTGDDGTYSISGFGSFDGWDQDIAENSVASIACGAQRVSVPIFDPPGGSKVPVSLSITTSTPDAIIRYTTDGTAPTVKSTEYTGPIDIDTPGVIQAKAYKDGMYESSASTARYLPEKSHKAIVVAGGGPYTGNSLWTSTRQVAEYGYMALRYQGYSKEDIMYLSAETGIDVDGNGALDDIDGEASSTLLQDVILNWAQDAKSLVIYLTDHGGENTFQMTPTDILNAADLDTWLDTLQESMAGQVLLIYDACRSGTFITSLTPPADKKRTIITSASNESAWFLRKGKLSFSYQFWASIFSNGKVYDAFNTASKMMGRYQTALIDADGDGIHGEANDQAAALGMVLGRGAVAAAVEPEIGTVSAPMVLGNEISATITASNISSLNEIAKIWAVITPPGYISASPDDPVIDMVEVEMNDSDANGIWEGSYDSFTETGIYNIEIYALDNEGLYSLPRHTFLTKNYVMPGDINNDASVDRTDLEICLKIIAGVTLQEAISLEADVNDDGLIGLEELLFILRNLQ